MLTLADDGWFSPANIIAVVGVLGTFLGLWLTWKAERRAAAEAKRANDSAANAAASEGHAQRSAEAAESQAEAATEHATAAKRSADATERLVEATARQAEIAKQQLELQRAEQERVRTEKAAEQAAKRPQLRAVLSTEQTHQANPRLFLINVANLGRAVRIDRVLTVFDDGTINDGVRLSGTGTLYKRLVKEAYHERAVPGELDRSGSVTFQPCNMRDWANGNSDGWRFTDEMWRSLKGFVLQVEGERIEVEDPDGWIPRIRENNL